MAQQNNQSELPETRYRRILGLEEFAPKQKYVCFLNGAMELGWLILCFVKRIHGYNSNIKKIVCTKKGWENLFPTADKFFYDWQDVPDELKAGIYSLKNQEEIKQRVLKEFGLTEEEVFWAYPEESGWEEKLSLAHHTFVPKQTKEYDVDVVIAPRLRKLDEHRNIPLDFWQAVVDGLVAKGLKVGIIGAQQTSLDVRGATYRSWEEIDIETDLNLILSSKCVILSETGTAYLAYLCNPSVFFVGHLHKAEGATKHINPECFFNNDLRYLADPEMLVDEVVRFCKND